MVGFRVAADEAASVDVEVERVEGGSFGVVVRWEIENGVHAATAGWEGDVGEPTAEEIGNGVDGVNENG